MKQATLNNRVVQSMRIAITSRNKSFKLWLPWLAIIGLTGCAITPTNISDMAAELSIELSSLQQDMMRPVNLEADFKSLLQEAIKTNPGYRAVIATERAARSNVGVAESVRWPQLSVNANLGALRELDSDGVTISGLAGGLTLSQLIFDGGESTATINRATADVLAAEAERLNLANNLALDVARSWFDVWQFNERIELLRNRSEELNTLVNQIERMASNGMIDRSALDSVRRQVIDIQLEEARLLSSRADAEVRFRRYFRQPASSLVLPPTLIAPADVHELAKHWLYAPSLALRAANLIAARHSVSEAKSAFRPRLSLQTGINSPLDSDAPSTGNFGFRFDYDVLDGRRRALQLEAAVSRVVALESQLRDDQMALESELAAALARLDSIETSIKLVARKRELSQSEAQTARTQLLTGQASLRQLVEAEIEAYRSEDQAIALSVERELILLFIAAQTGALYSEIGLDDPALH